MRVIWTVTHVPLVGTAYRRDRETTYRKFNGVKIKRKIGDAKDTFSLTLRITDPEMVGKFDIGDIVEIKREVIASYPTTDIYFTGRIVDNPWDKSPKKNELELEGYSYSDAIANGITFVDAENKTVSEAIKAGVQFMERFGSRTDPLKWEPTNEMLNSNGEPFPIVGERVYNKRLRYLVTKYSTNEETRDGTYIWYVTPENKFVWRRAGNDPDFTFNANTDKYLEVGEENDRDGIVNFVVIKGGTDPDGKGIEYTDWYSPSTLKYGQQPRVIPDISENANIINGRDMDYLQEQYDALLESLDPESQEYQELLDEGGYAGRNYPRERDYENGGFTTTWVSSVNNNQPVTVYNNREYKEAIREHVMKKLEVEAKRILEDNEFGEHKISVVFKPGKGWDLADVVEVTFSGVLDNVENMRVVEAEFTSTKDSFMLLRDTGRVE